MSEQLLKGADKHPQASGLLTVKAFVLTLRPLEPSDQARPLP
jgi:hypothetical protein